MSESDTSSQVSAHSLCQVVSGGQTGVDRAALDAALQAGVEIGGWCPRGRRAESGTVPAHYGLKETSARSYAVRTEWNVRDSDGTLILVMDEISSGTKLTLDFAQQQQKPCMVVHLRPPAEQSLFSDQKTLDEQIQSVVEWLWDHRIRVLNVAGPRGSSHRDIYREARSFVELLLKQTAARQS